MRPSRADWSATYAEAEASLPDWVQGSRNIVAGFTATVDAIHHLTVATLSRLMTAEPARWPPGFGAGLAEIQRRLRNGLDGELFVDDPEGESALLELIGAPLRCQAGGTSLQASWSWSAVGVAPLLSLSDRSSRQLDVVPAGVMIAGPDGPLPPADLDAIADTAPVPAANHILEFGKGLRTGSLSLPRSSRLSVVFRPKRLQHDPWFDAESAGYAAGGVGLVSGLNGLGPHRSDSLARIVTLLRAWQLGGPRFVHLELADYKSREELAEVLTAVGPYLNSIGMNSDEFRRLIDDRADIQVAARHFGEQWRLDRVCVHSDRWAMSVHRRDPAVETAALVAGCLAAAHRAATNAPDRTWIVPPDAEFAAELPAERELGGPWRSAVVATPYLAQPASTIGLGDTFVSGDLLVQSACG